MSRKYEESVHIYFDSNKLRHDANLLLDRKLKAVTKDPRLYKDLAVEIAELLDPFVPYDSGLLSDYLVDAKNGIIYRRYSENNPKFSVAEHQYKYPHDHSAPGVYRGTEIVHPLASDHWADQYHQSLVWDDFVDRALPIILEWFKEHPEA